MAERKKVECIFCDVPLVFNKEYGFLKCPDCGGEWWPGSPDYDLETLGIEDVECLGGER